MAGPDSGEILARHLDEDRFALHLILFQDVQNQMLLMTAPKASNTPDFKRG